MIAAAAVVDGGMVNITLAAFLAWTCYSGHAVAHSAPSWWLSVIGYFVLEPCNRMYTQTHKHINVQFVQNTNIYA